jgi:hypothetical protein
MSQASKREYLQRIDFRYGKAEAEEKQRLLNEFCANCITTASTRSAC